MWHFQQPTDTYNDRQTDRQIFWVGAWDVSWEAVMSILSIVSMNEPHWKTMRISGIKPLWKTMRISKIKPGIRPEESVLILSKKSPESVLSILSILSIVSMKEPGIKPQWKTMTILTIKG
ncbi:hypothetical protein DPMN_002117 [Dreissena polymorpha]|uniref:Uncharacterized protein n=1 Tax=Dreissena polymorpha TaxID=45954 RepID=A0A9D4MLC9_DREPO|nr:hypothetical protein DPMN_002117 [Dreissena polymorpha]